ncbi:transmembrane protein 217 [Sorex araneus]|uniref:transmembrane protein 217 n=1 Tax=Sorex araneus TaxID=42254 RepID=UPI00033155DE|nr:transmembrane protein 217 [Sorex araneus]
MKQKYWCGMTARMGTILSGAFSIISSNMYLIFEQNHLSRINCSKYKANYSSISFHNWHFSCNCLEIVFFLSFFTIIVSGFLIYSVYTRLLKGLLFYIIWIIFYECINILVQIYTNSSTTAIPIRALRWFGLIIRLSLHCFWIFFVINEAHMIYKLKCKVHVTLFNRHVSLGNEDITRRLSNSSSLSQQFLYY